MFNKRLCQAEHAEALWRSVSEKYSLRRAQADMVFKYALIKDE